MVSHPISNRVHKQDKLHICDLGFAGPRVNLKCESVDFYVDGPEPEANFLRRAKMRFLFSLAVLLIGTLSAAAQDSGSTDNPKIDMEGFLRVSLEAAEHRASRRLSEDEFLRVSQAPGTIILDARSKEKFDLLHIRGAINLSFPDITLESVQKMIPDKSTRVLIYCNNNFENAELAFPTKRPSASLNLSTYISLFDYGYRNIYELAPLLDPATSKLPFASNTSAQ